MRQQPRAARACGFGERDRRVVDPPPIVELQASDTETSEVHYESDSYTTLHCVLINEKTMEDESQIPAVRPDMSSAQRLMGNLVSSPCVAKDENGRQGSFFVFPDLSIRSPGRYRLLFRLLKINPQELTRVHAIVDTVISSVFEVFTAKEFPGMRASSPLLRALRAQGLNVGVKKGSEASKRNTKKKQQTQGESDDEGLDEDEEEPEKGERSDAEDDEVDDDGKQDDNDDDDDSSPERKRRPVEKQSKGKQPDSEPGPSKSKGAAKKKRVRNK